jgi:pteridine reductase
LTAPAGLCHFAREHLAKGGRGNIVNLCDISAERPSPNHLAYGVSKAGLAALTQGLARALAPDIRVNAVSPGIADFPESYSPELRQRLTTQVPLKREGTPEGIARAVRFLVESGDYITGQILAVDGGRSTV